MQEVPHGEEWNERGVCLCVRVCVCMYVVILISKYIDLFFWVQRVIMHRVI